MAVIPAGDPTGTVVSEHSTRVATRANVVALCLGFEGTLSPIIDDPGPSKTTPA
jgi:hypothetical protein